MRTAPLFCYIMLIVVFFVTIYQGYVKTPNTYLKPTSHILFAIHVGGSMVCQQQPIGLS